MGSNTSWIRGALAFSENLNNHLQCWIRPLEKHACGCSLAWFRTSACHVDDPGSNPGDRTHPILCSSPVTCLQGPEANAKRTGQIRPAFPQVKFSKRMRKSRFRKNCLIGSL